MTLRRLFLPNTKARAAVRLQKRADASTDALPEIAGLAAVYYNPSDPTGTQYQLWDNYFERILPGAFDRAVKEDDVRALQNHDPRLLLGRSSAGTLQLQLSEEGLGYIITTPNTTAGRDTVTSLERGDLDGSSFAFNISPGGVEWTEERIKVGGNEVVLYIRNITAVELFDVGPVTYPAYSATSAGTRSPRMFLERTSDNAEVQAIEGECRAWRTRLLNSDQNRAKREREILLAELS